MVRITLGEKGERMKWNIYFLGIVLLIFVATCHVLRRFDWASVQRSALEKYFYEFEDEIVLSQLDADKKVLQLVRKCSQRLRDGYMAGYLIDRSSGRYYFIGRPWGPFRKAVEAQKSLIDAGEPFDRDKIPKLRLVVDFEKLNCRLLASEVDRGPWDRPHGGRTPRP